MTRWLELTPATIIQIAFEVRERKADPDDARRVLELFCNSTDGKISPELIHHLQACFRDHLYGGVTLEAALGIAGKRGRPNNGQERVMMALSVLRHRVNGSTYEDSEAAVSEEFHRSESVIREAWSAHKQDALIALRLERAADKYPWTNDEISRLSAIFVNEPWLNAPEKAAN